jgi:hypothetical protein
MARASLLTNSSTWLAPLSLPYRIRCRQATSSCLVIVPAGRNAVCCLAPPTRRWTVDAPLRTLRRRTRRHHRPFCRSQPPARIPQGPPERAYDIKYYTRDVRKAPLPSDIAIDASFHPEAAKLLDRPALIEAPKPGSPGMKVGCAPRVLEQSVPSKRAAARCALWCSMLCSAGAAGPSRAHGAVFCSSRAGS